MAVLTVGSRGDNVKSLQQQLANQGYKIAVDGIYGAQTKSAVSQYQQKSGLAVDGIAGNQTMGSLSKLSSPAPVQQAPVQQIPQQTQPQQTPTSNIPYADNPEVAQMDSFLQQQKNAQIDSTTASLDAKLANDIKNLQSAYEQAVADGNISIRDAESEFQTQKTALEKQAYQDAQRTTLYGQEMGIQNSQQQQGLMQGDAARNADRINANVNTRDKRINDIKDRISVLTKQKNLDTANAQSEHDAGVISAKADAENVYTQNMFNVAKDTYNFNNSLKQLQEQSRLQIEQMNIQHGLDLDKMQKDLENQITLEQKKYGLQSALQSQAAKQAQASAISKAKADMQAEQQAYEIARQRELAKYTPGTDEYKIKEAQLQETYKDQISKIHAATIYDATAKSILGDPALSSKPSGSKPVDYTQMTTSNGTNLYGSLLGGVMNLVTPNSGAKAVSQYNAQQAAYQSALARKNDFISNPTKYLGY